MRLIRFLWSFWCKSFKAVISFLQNPFYFLSCSINWLWLDVSCNTFWYSVSNDTNFYLSSSNFLYLGNIAYLVYRILNPRTWLACESSNELAISLSSWTYKSLICFDNFSTSWLMKIFLFFSDSILNCCLLLFLTIY